MIVYMVIDTNSIKHYNIKSLDIDDDDDDDDENDWIIHDYLYWWWNQWLTQTPLNITILVLWTSMM